MVFDKIQRLGGPMTFRRALFASVAAMMAVGPVHSALAQDITLEEIVVTSQRRAQNLQETPLAVTALTSLQIERQQVTETLDLLRSVPNMQGNNNVTIGLSNSYFLRGIGNTESIATFDVPVGTYVDDIYIARQNGNNIELVDIERIEVLRGPQGTLFGRNTTGGAINVITRKPGEEFQAKGEVAYGRFNEIRGKASIDVPISDKVLTNFSAYYLNDDGWMDGQTTGEKYNFQESLGVRAALRLLPSDNVTWDVTVDYSDTDHQNLGASVDGPASQTNTSAGSDGPWQGANGRQNFTNLRNCKDGDTALEWIQNGCTANEVYGYNLSSNLAIDASDWLTINVITGYRNLDHSFASPLLDNNPGNTLGLDEFGLANDGQHNQFSQEIKFNADLMDGRIQLVTGGFYMKEDNRTIFQDLISLGEGALVNAITANRDMENDTESFAWYGQFDYEIIDRLTLTAGLRWTDEKKTVGIDFFDGAGAPVFDEGDIPAPDQFTTVKFTPRVAIQYEATDDLMFYASATNGFKSGGWNARSTSAATFTAFQEETVWSYELGMRAEFWDNRARLNVTAYDANYDDIQIATVLPGTATFVTQNAGDTGNRGLEIEASAAVTDGLNIFGSFGYMDAEFKTLLPIALASGFTPDTVPVRSPDFTAQAGFSYITTLDNGGDVNVNADVQITDDFEVNNQNGPSGSNQGYETVNASVGYDNEDGTWGVSLGCKNCLNKKYWTTDFLSTRFLGNPMTWSLRLKFAYN